MGRFNDNECAEIPAGIVTSGEFMFFFHKNFYRRDKKIKIIGKNLQCSPDVCNNSSVIVLHDPNTHPERCQDNRNPFCGVPVPCEFQETYIQGSTNKCIYLCRCILPTGENVCTYEQRIAVSIGPGAAQGVKPLELCGLVVFGDVPSPWWRHGVITASALVALRGMLLHMPVMRIFGVSIVVRLNKVLNEQSSYWWFEMLWRLCDVNIMNSTIRTNETVDAF